MFSDHIPHLFTYCSNFGHCFTLEDGGEVDNVFRNNLGALSKKVSTLISNDETDDEPSTYWITNPQVCILSSS